MDQSKKSPTQKVSANQHFVRVPFSRFSNDSKTYVNAAKEGKRVEIVRQNSSASVVLHFPPADEADRK